MGDDETAGACNLEESEVISSCQCLILQRIVSTTPRQTAERREEENGRNKLHTGKLQPPPFYLFILFLLHSVCQNRKRERERRKKSFLRRLHRRSWHPGGRSLIPALIQSHNNGGEIPFCRCNRRPVYAARLHNQIQTLFSTISLPTQPPPPHPPLSLFLFFFKRAESIRKATSLFCHLRVCCTSISFPSTLTRFRAGQFPLLSISFHLFLPGF